MRYHELTDTISTQRKVAQATTNKPLLKRMIKPSFFIGRKVDCQSIGMGMEIKYKSVATLKER